MHLLTNRMFSKWALSINFRMAFFLSKGLVWQILGLKLIILKDSNCSILFSQIFRT